MFSENLQLVREARNKQYVRSRISCIQHLPHPHSLHNRPFMSQARQMRHFAQSAKCETREKKNCFSSPRLALRACFELRAKYCASLAWLIKHLLCRLLRFTPHYWVVASPVTLIVFVLEGKKRSKIKILNDYSSSPNGL